MYSFDIPPEFDKLYAENGLMRAQLAVLLEEHEYDTRFMMPAVKNSYLIQVGALRAELLAVQIEIRKVRRRIALTKEGASDISRRVADEFRQWDDRLRYEWSEIENAKAMFSFMGHGEDMEEIRTIYRSLSRKMSPEVNAGQSEEAYAFWPSIKTAYITSDIFQLKALAMMAEDYPDSYDMPNDIGAMRRENEALKAKIAAAEEMLKELRKNPAFEWKRLLDDPDALRAEQAKLRDEIAAERMRQRALDDILRSIDSNYFSYKQ